MIMMMEFLKACFNRFRSELLSLLAIVTFGLSMAESNGEVTAVGYIRVRDREFGVGLFEEFRFLGQDKP